MRDYYEVLELDRGATAEQVKANYRRLAMKWHPDRNAGSAEAEERFKSISEAYATLSDPEGRRRYDAYLEGSAARTARSGRSSRDGREHEGAYEGEYEGEPGYEGAYYFFRGAGGAGGGARGYGFERGFAGFTAQDAADMFTREMYALATELTLQNVGWRDIAAELERRGCPSEVAAGIARKIEKRRKEVIRGNARPYFLRSAVSGFFGLCIFGLFGGIGFGLIGLVGLLMFLSGGYNLVRALYFIATGKAPRALL